MRWSTLSLVGLVLLFQLPGCDIGEEVSYFMRDFSKKREEKEHAVLRRYKASASMSEPEITKRHEVVRRDLRSIATAIESYCVDYQTYPKPQMPDETLPIAITTPIAYLVKLPDDAFAGPEDRQFHYRINEDSNSWIAWAIGPDQDDDLDNLTAAEMFAMNPPEEALPVDASASQPPSGVTHNQPPAELLRFSYDPSNGTVSDGDIWWPGP